MNIDIILKFWKNTELSITKCAGCPYFLETYDVRYAGGSPVHIECELDSLRNPSYQQCQQVQDMVKGIRL